MKYPLCLLAFFCIAFICCTHKRVLPPSPPPPPTRADGVDSIVGTYHGILHDYRLQRGGVGCDTCQWVIDSLISKDVAVIKVSSDIFAILSDIEWYNTRVNEYIDKQIAHTVG